ncbi:MAG TPA: hypothetical protein VI336_03805 [Candidatus Saccharimonadales bacterium]|nr:hypothetical protein [Candidatus Saccharimonadales bacterium]
MKFIKKMPKFWLAVIAGLLLGALVILAIRFFTYDAGYVHYHANFAVYINGQQEKFEGSTYYEEETSCKAESHMTPEDRVHMHDDVYDVVHVHDHAATWGQFFENLGWGLGKDYIKSRDILYQNNNGSNLSIILNGQNLTGISSVTNQVIGNEDKLLLSFGEVSNDELQKEYKAIPNTAREHNQEDDPASCSGPSKTTTSDRLRNLF